MKKQKTSLANMEGKLSRSDMKNIVGGTCNPGPYYNHPCTVDLDCGGTACATTLYCYHANPKNPTGVCLFR